MSASMMAGCLGGGAATTRSEVWIAPRGPRSRCPAPQLRTHTNANRVALSLATDAAVDQTAELALRAAGFAMCSLPLCARRCRSGPRRALVGAGAEHSEEMQHDDGGHDDRDHDGDQQRWAATAPVGRRIVLREVRHRGLVGAGAWARRSSVVGQLTSRREVAIDPAALAAAA
jgi:hypothetical protein